MCRKLFWTLLEPGPDEDFDTDDARGMVANWVFAFYQISSVILLMNLLIAVMNATTSRVFDLKETYWIFTRTEIWVEFFDTFAAFPPPFAVFNLAWFLIYFVYVCIRNFLNWVGILKSRESVKPGQCWFDAGELSRRKEHALLMQRLIRRYYKNCYLTSTSSEDVTKEDLKQLKRELIEEFQGIIRFNASPLVKTK